MLANLIGAIADLSAHALRVEALLELVVDGEEIVDRAVVRIGAGAETHADRGYRMFADGPVHYVQVVNVLLDDVIAAQPGVAVPIPDLLLDVGGQFGMVFGNL